MPDGALVIVIDGTREDWPGGPRTLTPLDPDLEPNRRTCWFGAALAPAGPQVLACPMFYTSENESLHHG